MRMFAIVSVVLLSLGNVFPGETNKDAFALYKSGDMQKAFRIYSKVLLEEGTSFKERMLAQCGKCCCMFRMGYEIEEVTLEMHYMHDVINECYEKHPDLLNHLYTNSAYREILRELL